jgi:hypothetical protein
MIYRHMTFDSEKLYERNKESLLGIPTDEFMSLISPKTERAISMQGVEDRINSVLIQLVLTFILATSSQLKC